MALLIDGVSRRFPVTAVAGSAFQFPDPLFEQLELLARAFEHGLLDLELLATHEVHFRERGLQRTVEVLSGIVLQRRQASGQ